MTRKFADTGKKAAGQTHNENASVLRTTVKQSYKN